MQKAKAKPIKNTAWRQILNSPPLAPENCVSECEKYYFFGKFSVRTK